MSSTIAYGVELGGARVPMRPGTAGGAVYIAVDGVLDVGMYGDNGSGGVGLMPQGVPTSPISVSVVPPAGEKISDAILYSNAALSPEGSTSSIWATLPGGGTPTIFIRDVFIRVQKAGGGAEYPMVDPGGPLWSTTVGLAVPGGGGPISVSAVNNLIGYVPLLDPQEAGASVGYVFVGGKIPVNRRVESYNVDGFTSRVGVNVPASGYGVTVMFSYSFYES